MSKEKILILNLRAFEPPIVSAALDMLEVAAAPA